MTAFRRYCFNCRAEAAVTTLPKTTQRCAQCGYYPVMYEKSSTSEKKETDHEQK